MYKFEVKSGKLVVSDPCYNLGTWCQKVLENVKSGNWIGEAEFSDDRSWGERVCALVVRHESCANHPYTLESADIGVDSGQAGFFDFDSYRNDEIITVEPKFDCPIEEKGDKWYNACCDKTLSDDKAGDVPGGVVSSSGYGDGSYRLYTHRDKDGQVVAAKVVFIEEKDDDDEEETCGWCSNGYDHCSCCPDCGDGECDCNKDTDED